MLTYLISITAYIHNDSIIVMFDHKTHETLNQLFQGSNQLVDLRFKVRILCLTKASCRPMLPMVMTPAKKIHGSQERMYRKSGDVYLHTQQQSISRWSSANQTRTHTRTTTKNNKKKYPSCVASYPTYLCCIRGMG